MSSIVTNSAASAALRTLRSVNSGLQKTQEQVSSGLRVARAADNAAYWSVATTMRSDTKAISAVSDALGIGAAVADTAYVGTRSIADVLSEFKAKIVAAKEDGVDRSKVQDELAQLNSRAESIVATASFNGQNWLATYNPDPLSEVEAEETQIVSSFVRNPDGSISIETAIVDLKQTSMLNTGGGGILQKEVDGDYPDLAPLAIVSYYHEGHEDHYFAGPVTFGASDAVGFDFVLDRSDLSSGVSYPITVDKALVDAALGTADGVIKDANDLRKVFQKAFDDAGAPASAYRSYTTDPHVYDIMTRESSGHIGSSVYFENITTTLAGGQVLGLNSVPGINHDNMHTTGATTFRKPFTMPDELEISFDMTIAGGTMQTVTIKRDTVNSALGISTGRVETADEFAQVIAYAAGGMGISIDVDGSTLNFSADQAIYPGYGNHAVDFQISDFRSSINYVLRFDLAEIDVTGDQYSLDDYLTGVEYMLRKTVASASDLGSIRSRIDMQADFASRLHDSLLSGIGRLVDTDMEVASSVLTAQQTQQQLALQALSIANSVPRATLSLFQ